MAERLTAARALCVLTAAAASAGAAAQAGLPDPTRPPAADGTSAARGDAAKSAHRVESVLISAERKLAVIDGRTVPLGGQIDGARVVAITEAGVTLRRGEQTEVLPLNAGVQKKVLP